MVCNDVSQSCDTESALKFKLRISVFSFYSSLFFLFFLYRFILPWVTQRKPAVPDKGSVHTGQVISSPRG